ncbi:Exportin-4-like protein, partial [Leptotrombidium deliense]
MSAEIVQQLESYANVLLAPPTEVNNEQRKEAQTVFIEFQKTKTPFELCRHVLETSNVVFVQFQAAACLKNGVIRDWSYLKQENMSLQLLNYLLEFVGSRQQLENCVREQLLLVCAIILKRCGIDENSEAHRRLRLRQIEVEDSTEPVDANSQLPQVSVNMFNSVLSVISMLSSDSLQSFSSPQQNGDITYIKGMTACSFILAILNEYSSSTRASDFGLPWIKHLDTKKKFETNHLKNIFSTVLQALHNTVQPQVNSEVLRRPECLSIILKLVQILETILTWNFDLITIISSQYAKHVDGIENPVLQPGLDWVDIFINGNIIEFIFYLYIRIRDLGDEKLTHHSLQCLSQLSSLTGTIISNPKNRIQFISFFLNGTLHLLKQGFHKFEAVPVSTMLYRICLHLQSRDTIKLVDKEICVRFVTMMCDLTCKLFVDYLKAEEGKDINDESDAEKFKQAIDNFCDAWMVLMQAIEKYEKFNVFRSTDSPTDEVDGGSSSRQSQSQDVIDQRVINECSRKIFECFLRCHLTQPEGLRGLVSKSVEADIYDFEEGDHVTYNEQLNAIGCFARVDASHSISCLTQLLNLRVNQLQSCLQSITSNSGAEVQQQWACINEDIHWLIMIVTWTLTQSNYGERDMIPLQLMHLSINSNSDSTKTVNALRSCDVGTDDSKVDPIVKLLLCVFKICSLEKYILENKMHCLMSPQVSLTLTLFITRFLCGYLLPNENDYTDMSLCLNACFGRDSPAAADTLNFLFDHIITKLFAWSSEADVTESSAAALVTFIQNSPERGKALM